MVKAIDKGSQLMVNSINCLNATSQALKKTIKDIRTNVGKQLDYNISRNNDLKTIHMGLVNAITNFTNVKNLAFANVSNANMKFFSSYTTRTTK
jgi:hypothetical protein